jgi:hypothetical protein
MLIPEGHTKKFGSVQKACPESGRRGPSSPVLRPLEGKAPATWTGGAYEGVREHGQGATCLRACARSASARRRETAPAGRERRWPACRPAEPTPAKARRHFSTLSLTISPALSARAIIQEIREIRTAEPCVQPIHAHSNRLLG